MHALYAADGGLLIAIQEHLTNPALTAFFTFITKLGDSGLIWVVLTVILLIIKKYRYAGVTAALSLVTEFTVCNLFLKNLVARARPYDALPAVHLLIEKQTDFSFPSGHSSSSFAVAVVMFIMLPKKYGVPALILAFVIAFSRLYVGVHYPTDVLCGALIGTGAALLFCWLYRKFFRKAETEN